MPMKFHPLTIFLIFCFIVPCLSEIRYTKIRPKDPSLVYMDYFGFTKAGRLELNLSHISIISNLKPSSSSNFNLSHIGFFLALSPSSLDGKKNCYLAQSFDYSDSDEILVLHTFEQGIPVNKNNTLDLMINYSSVTDHSALYDIYFQNCLQQQFQVSMNIRSSAYNLDPNSGHPNYLSAGMNCIILTSFLFICIYLSLIAFWVYTLHGRKTHQVDSSTSSEGGGPVVVEIHQIMMCYAIFKLLSFVVELVNLEYTRNIGYAQSYVAVLLAYVWGVFGRTLPLFGLVYCVARGGWTFMRREPLPMLLSILIRLMLFIRFGYNLFLSSATICWPSIFTRDILIKLVVISHFFDSIGLYVMVFPTKWTAEHLAHNWLLIEKNAALLLRKVKLFEQFYIDVLIYFIGAFALSISFEYLTMLYIWPTVFAEESLILVIYLVMVYRFHPDDTITENDIISVEEEITAAEALRTYNFNRAIFG